MNGHVTQWLAAYYDGELHGLRQQRVQEHLSDCPACQAELEKLHKLSVLLQEAPSPVSRLSAQRFQAQVMLRLPPKVHRPGWQRGLKAGWQLAPLSAILVWAIGQAAWLVASLVLVLGLPLGLSGAGMLIGVLNLASASPAWGGAETIIELSLLNLAFSSLVAIFLCGWLASWWVVRRSSQNGIDLLANSNHTPESVEW
jgi:anti-sigma factor RsiW